MPVDSGKSSKYWVNDTIEAFRSCPLYGSGQGGEYITIIGRNFRDTNRNFCKWRSCISANEGRHPRRCLNNLKQITGEDLPVVGEVSESSFITPARYISTTRMECQVPEFEFNETIFIPLDGNTESTKNACQYIGFDGNFAPDGEGNYSYVRSCDNQYDCLDKPEKKLEYHISLTLPCSVADILASTCTNTPEPGYMMNPCMTNEALIEVSNDGQRYSGGFDLKGVSILSTARLAPSFFILNYFHHCFVLFCFVTLFKNIYSIFPFLDI